MHSEPPEPLLGNPRSSLRIEDFCLNTGFDRDTVENLIRERFLEDSLWTWEEPSRPRSIFIDALPSRETLAAMGLPVRDDYDPENLRYGGIVCRTHGWAQSVLLTRYDDDSQRQLPDRSMCWDCSRAGVPPGSGNSRPIDPAEVERWRQTHDHEGTWTRPEDDE
ncbi:MAG: hypothetical protein WAV00_18590 [Nocardioides sp.]